MITRLIIIVMVSFTLGASSGRNVKSEISIPGERFLIITADDFGAARNINEGIRLAAINNLITTISALTNFPESTGSLKSISEENPNIGIGVHLNITTGKPVSDPALVPTLVNKNGNFYTINEILPQLRKISLDELRIELRSQIQILSDNGIRVDHLSDQHGILTLYPPFLNVVIELAKEYHLPLRSPVVASMKYPDIFPKSSMKEAGYKILRAFLLSNPGTALSYVIDFQFKQINERAAKLDSAGIVHPDLLIDCFYGNPTVSNLRYILANLPPGVNELVLHLGTHDGQMEYPTGLDLDYFDNRELELSTVSTCSFNEYLKFLNVKKTRFSEINTLKNQ
jgi:chitin disaccharide deacetylase